MSSSSNSQKGFTLIELLIVVALLVVTVGVSSDIIVSLVRSYNKTRITNEIEQNSNFVLLKLSKELRDADSVAVSNGGSRLTIDREINEVAVQVVYDVSGGDLLRSVDGGTQVPMINDDPVSGVQIDVSDGIDNFTDLSPTSDGSIISLHFVFVQRGSSASRSFSGSVTLDDTVVVRGAY